VAASEIEMGDAGRFFELLDALTPDMGWLSRLKRAVLDSDLGVVNSGLC
jgi:hypothetical protein